MNPSAASRKEEERQEWLLATLHALRGHFRARRPAEPHDRTIVKNDQAETVLIHCIDSWHDEKKLLKAPRGEFFEQTAISAAIQPFDESHGKSLQNGATLSFTLQRGPKVRNVVIMGHTDCGGIGELYKALLAGAKPADSPEAGWMLPMLPESVKQAVVKADERGVKGEDIKRKLEQIVVLESMQNAYHYTVGNGRVKDRVDNGDLHIIGAIRDFHEDASGKLPLLVFDPKKKDFVPIEDLYLEAFPGRNDRSVRPLNEAVKAGGDFIVPKSRGTSRTVAEIELKDIRQGIQKLLKDINKMQGPSPVGWQ